MPAPPRKDESKDAFMGRAIAYMVKEGRAQAQAIAMAYSMWAKKHKKKD